MAHYDCSNCGKRMGLSFGECGACTPVAHGETIKAISHIYNELAGEWDKSPSAIKGREKVDAAQLALETKRRKWTEKRAKNLGINKLRKVLHELRMKHHHAYRRDFEATQNRENNA